MSRLMSKRADQHVIFSWHIQLSRPHESIPVHESTSVAVQVKDTELSISFLHHMSWPHESIPVHKSIPWVDSYAWVDPMSRPLRWKNSTTASFQLILATFNAHLMCSNGSILVQITLHHYLKL